MIAEIVQQKHKLWLNLQIFEVCYLFFSNTKFY